MKTNFKVLLLASTALVATTALTTQAVAQVNIATTPFTSTVAATGAVGGNDAVGTAGFNVTGGTPTSITIGHNGTGGQGGPATGNNIGQNGGAGFGTAAAFGANAALTFSGTGVTMQGGAGSAAAVGANNALAAAGGIGGAGVSITQNNIATLISSVNLTGAIGGAGGASAGATGTGGAGGQGGTGFVTGNAIGTLTLTGTIQAGAGGSGGAATGAANGSNGGAGGAGGIGVNLNQAVTTASINGVVNGGLGGNGTVTTDGGAGVDGIGGAGGVALNLGTAASTVTLGSAARLTGGNGGVAGAVDTTANEASGAGGAGVVVGVTSSALTIQSGAIVQGGNGGVLANTTSGNAGSGINIATGLTSVTLNNAGTILAGTAGGLTANTIGALNIDSDMLSLINSGTIGSTTAGVSSITVQANDGAATFTNTGGTIVSNAAQGTVRFVNGVRAGGQTITGGTIRNVTATQGAIVFDAAGTNRLTLVDTTVQGHILGSGGNDVVQFNGGSIAATDIINLNAGAANELAFGTGTFTTASTNATRAAGGTLTLVTASGANVTFNHNVVAGDNVSTLVNASGATFRINSDVVGSGAFTNNGTIILGQAADTTVASLAAGGAGNVYEFRIGGTGAEEVGTFVSAGAFNFTNSTVRPVIDTTGANSFIANLTDVRVFDGGGAGTLGALTDGGLLTATTGDTSVLYNYRTFLGNNAAVTGAGSGDANDLWIQVERAAASTLTTSSNNLAVADFLFNTVQNSGDAGVDAIQAALGNTSTQTGFNNILESVSPTVDGGAVNAALSVGGEVSSLVGDRLASLRGDGTGMAAGDGFAGTRVWGQVFGKTGEQDTRDGIKGFDSDTYGVAVGLDREVMDGRANLGIALSYGDTEVDSKNLNTTTTEVDSYQVSLYGDYDFNGATYIEGLAAYAFNSNDQVRKNVNQVANNNATADFDANQFTVMAEVGHAVPVSTGFKVVPNVLTHWTHYDADDYTETGSSQNLRVDGEALNVFELGAGVDFVWEYENASGDKFEPEIRLGYRYDLVGDEIEATTSFVGAPAAGSFRAKGADPAQGTFNVGAGLSFLSTTNWELRASYDFNMKEDYDAHSGYLRAAYRY